MEKNNVINECTHCIAFWDGESRGTKHDIELCDKRGKPCKVVPVNGAENQRGKFSLEEIMDRHAIPMPDLLENNEDELQPLYINQIK